MSPKQAAEVADAATADRSAEGGLLNAADRDGLKGLKDKCQAVKAAVASAQEERARHERIRASRYFRSWTDSDGSFRFAGRTTNDVGAKMLAALQPFKNDAFEAARREGRREPHDAYAADALEALIDDATLDPLG